MQIALMVKDVLQILALMQGPAMLHVVIYGLHVAYQIDVAIKTVVHLRMILIVLYAKRPGSHVTQARNVALTNVWEDQEVKNVNSG
jgi:hypothetical protein